MPDETDERIRRASERAAEAAERTARAHEHAADQHERHAEIAEEIGENLEDAHRARENAQRIRGLIVQVGSALARRGIPLQATYCSAKHATKGFCDSRRGGAGVRSPDRPRHSRRQPVRAAAGRSRSARALQRGGARTQRAVVA